MTTEPRKAIKRMKKEKKRKSLHDGLAMDQRKKRKLSSSRPRENQSQKLYDFEKIESKRQQDMPATLAAGAAAVTFPHRYIVAPMVGASELPFRLLTRKYGAQLVYTPMMVASEFVNSEEYRAREFQTTTFDRPLVCHFAAVS